MKKLIIPIIIMIFLSLAFDSCSASRKNQSELRGLMLQDNLHMGRNKAYFSKHNVKARKDVRPRKYVDRKFRKNNRNV